MGLLHQIRRMVFIDTMGAIQRALFGAGRFRYRAWGALTLFHSSISVLDNVIDTIVSRRKYIERVFSYPVYWGVLLELQSLGCLQSPRQEWTARGIVVVHQTVCE